MRSISKALSLVALGIVSGCGHIQRDGLYTDAEAVAMGKRAEGLIPNGTTKPKRDVFAALGLDPHRLREHRIGHRVMNVYFEFGRLSPSYQISWMMAAQDTTPHESSERQIYGLHIQPYEQR